MIHLINMVSLLTIVLSCLFLIFAPQIELHKPVEFMLWGMVFITSGVLLGGSDRSLVPDVEVAFRCWLAIFAVTYSAHKYLRRREQH